MTDAQKFVRKQIKLGKSVIVHPANEAGFTHIECDGYIHSFDKDGCINVG